MKNLRERKFYGTTTLGEKGQVVIPAEARQSLNLKKGEKLLVFGIGDLLAISRLANLEKFAAHLTEHLGQIRAIIKKTA